MSKFLFEKEYAIIVTETAVDVEIVDPTDSMLVVVPAPFLGIETVKYKRTSTGEIHVTCGVYNFIFTKPVVNGQDFVEESLLKMLKTFKLPISVLSEFERTFFDFLEYTKKKFDQN